jgi:hypothetical protein
MASSRSQIAALRAFEALIAAERRALSRVP